MAGVFLVAVQAATVLAAPLTPGHLRCEDANEPVAVDVTAPRFSWQLEAAADDCDKRQTAYEIHVASQREKLSAEQLDLWNSGRVASAEQAHIPYAGLPLASSLQAHWSVRVWDEHGEPSPWSPPAKFTMGLLHGEDWHGAQWITHPELLKYRRRNLGYRSLPAQNRDEQKWLALDLGGVHALSEVILRGVRHGAAENLGMPVRFRVEIAKKGDYSDAVTILDQTREDYSNPWATTIHCAARGEKAQFIRIVATRLRDVDGEICFALSQVEAISDGRNVAAHAAVTAGDAVDDLRWAPAAATDGLGVPTANPVRNAPIILGRSVEVRPNLKRAVAFVCGLGHYQLSVNGQPLPDQILAGPWTQSDKTVVYDARELATRLHAGANHLEITLAGGMYNVAEERYVKFTTPFRPLVAKVLLLLEYQDGAIEHVVTDAAWQAAFSPTTFANIYGGEDFDARRIGKQNWQAATVVDGPAGVLRGAASSSPPLREFEVLAPQITNKISPDVVVYDLGQNASLLLDLSVRGPAGAKVKIIPAELLRDDGRVNRDSCGHGEASWNYTLAGGGASGDNGKQQGESWAPRFFYHGARYFEVQLAPAATGGPLPVVEKLAGVVVQSDSSPAGDFACSHDLLNRIRTLVRWAQRSNMTHSITDCPHRERLGWLEQDHLHGPALRYEWDLGRLFVKTLQDMADSQTASGLIPDTAPEYIVFPAGFRDSPEWGAAYVVVPWQHYLWTGDKAPLEKHFAGMCRYVDYLQAKSTDGIVSHGLGDWYDVGPQPPGIAQLTPVPLTATAMLVHTADIVAKTAELLGRTEQAQRYAEAAHQTRTAFQAKFWNEAQGVYAAGSQTALAMPLVLGMVPAEHRTRLAAALADRVAADGYAVTAGDIGHRYLLRALADAGRSDVVMKLHGQPRKVGYAAILARGATALTEAWDADPHASQNHFMLGHVTEWFYHDLVGIQLDEASPGFRHFVVAPQPVPGVDWARAEYRSPRGPIRVAWQIKAKQFSLDVTVPPNSTATLKLPSGKSVAVGSGRHNRQCPLPPGPSPGEMPGK